MTFQAECSLLFLSCGCDSLVVCASCDVSNRSLPQACFSAKVIDHFSHCLCLFTTDQTDVRGPVRHLQKCKMIINYMLWTFKTRLYPGFRFVFVLDLMRSAGCSHWSVLIWIPEAFSFKPPAGCECETSVKWRLYALKCGKGVCACVCV